MKKPTIVLLLLLAAYYAGAQKIKAYEYWVDDNVSAKVFTSIEPVKNLHLQQALPITTASPGFHTFSIRFADNTNEWSSVLSQFFVMNHTSGSDTRRIMGYEYWFDDDLAGITYQQITPAAQFHLAGNLNLNALSYGFHLLNLRFKDDIGSWSTILNQFFVYNPPANSPNRVITGYEYWIDDGYAGKIYQQVTPSSQFHLSDNLDLNAVTNGLHVLNLRFRDDMGRWSTLLTRFFTNFGATRIIPNKTVAYRFWFDNDLATQETIILPQPVNIYHWSDTVETPFLAIGNHTFNYQFKDSSQALSSIRTDTFNVTSCLPHGGRAITGSASVCVGQTGVVYSVRKIKNANTYTWSIPAGASIISGNNTNSITVNFSMAAVPGDVSVYANNPCGNGNTMIFPVIVHQLPHPTLAGSDIVCSGTSGWVYTTEIGKSNYTWTVSPGNTMTSGGTSASPTAMVTWNSTGAQWIRVNYINEFGCTDTTDTKFDVFVKQTPSPALSGRNSLCIGTSNVLYTTEAGMANYTWSISTGGTITAGGTTTNNTMSLTWNTAGDRWIKLNYTNEAGCPGLAPAQHNVTVNPLPVPAITGPESVCVTSSENFYATQTFMTDYLWTISPGGTITLGIGTNIIKVTWNTAGPKTVSVNYTNTNGCTAAAPAVHDVTVNLFPAEPVSITGPAQVIQRQTGVGFSVGAIVNATGYSWTLPQGASIASGDNTSSIVVDFGAGAVSGEISVHGTNGCGNGTESPAMMIVVIPASVALENVSVGSGQSNCYSAAQTIFVAGSGTTFEVKGGGSATMIAGQNILYRPVSRVFPGGYLHGYITTSAQYCGQQPAPMMAVMSGEEDLTPGVERASFRIYPNPTTGSFTLEFPDGPPSETIHLAIFNIQGKKLLTHETNGERSHVFSLSGRPAGLYMIRVVSGTKAETVRIVRQ